MALDDLGPRICIMGPSGSGKSTLAAAISRMRGLKAVHLDQLSHVPHRDWVRRPAQEFETLHDMAIAGREWVIEGNYSSLLARRLERASGFVLLDVSTSVSLCRYIRRGRGGGGTRYGAVEGARDRLTLRMIGRLIGATRTNRARYREVFDALDLPKVRLASPAALEAFYRLNGLRRL